MSVDDPAAWAVVGLTFLLAGLIKGVIGLGLPTVSLGLLTAAIGLTEAMALLLVPSFVTNLMQALTGGQGRQLIRRLWPFFLPAMLMVGVGAVLLVLVDLRLLSALLGLLLVLYGGISLAGLKLYLSDDRQRWLGPMFGAINGILTGMTGSFVVPGAMYLQATGLPRDQLVQAMGILFTASTLALALALGGNRLISLELGAASLGAVVPAIAGMLIGQNLRHRLSDQVFRRVFFSALLVLGAYIIFRSAL